MLGAPPAFVLSQDQTLNLIILKLLYRSNKLFSEQLWRFVQIALLLWITCLDFQKKSGFSFIRIYCLIFKLLVKSHLISHSSYWRISLDSSIGKISLSWKAVSFVTALLLYHAVSFLSRGFLKFFEKNFWGSFQLLNKLLVALHKLFPSGLCIDTIFKLLDRRLTWGLNPCLTRQLVYNTTGRRICQRFFEDLERWVKMEKFLVRICGNSCISFRKAVKKV